LALPFSWAKAIAPVYPNLLALIGDVAHTAWRARAVGVYRLWRPSPPASPLDADGIQAAIWLVAVVAAAAGLVAAICVFEPTARSGPAYDRDRADRPVRWVTTDLTSVVQRSGRARRVCRLRVWSGPSRIPG
jgi:hypothetical protein